MKLLKRIETKKLKKLRNIEHILENLLEESYTLLLLPSTTSFFHAVLGDHSYNISCPTIHVDAKGNHIN